MGTNNTTISAQQLADVNTQLAQARTAEADSQAKAKVIREMIKQGRIGDVPDVANNELIRRISEQRVNLRAEVALQSRTLLPGHPHMQELTAQLQDVDQQLRMAAEKAVRALENDAHIAASRVDNLKAALDVQKTTASAAGADQVQLNTLELQARLLKDQLEFNTSKYQEALARQSSVSTPADARLISRADAPQMPSFPKKLPIIAIATLAGLLLSLGVVIGRELLSGSALTEAEAVDPLPHNIGLKPSLHTETVEVADAAPIEAAPRPKSVIDHLRELRLTRDGPVATRVLMTATSAKDATGRAALDLGRELAQAGRTILVDFDRVSPMIDTSDSISGGTMDLPIRAGLSELLSGEATFAEIIHRDGSSRLHVVPSGQSALVDSTAPDYGLVIEALAETYDFVLLHSALPTQVLTRQIAACCDAAVVILADGQPEAEAVAFWSEFEAVSTAPMFAITASAFAAETALRYAA